jgi:hypothetical protein
MKKKRKRKEEEEETRRRERRRGRDNSNDATETAGRAASMRRGIRKGNCQKEREEEESRIPSGGVEIV